MYFVRSLILAVTVLFAPAVAVAQIQPGSAGGTIGKHEKSISGGEEQPKVKSRSSHARPRPASKVTAVHHGPRPAAAPPPETNSGATCGIAGDARSTAICH
jgi:hypothetical protein